MIDRGNSECGATFSECGMYRYRLWRRWDEGAWMLPIIGLNPSTADETKDDATIRKCIKFAKRDGYGGLLMLNLFAFRSTDPKGLKSIADPVGPDNDIVLRMHIDSLDAPEPVAAWGTQPQISRVASRALEVYQWRLSDGSQAVTRLRCFDKAKDGSPRHPLYLKDSTPIIHLRSQQRVDAAR